MLQNTGGVITGELLWIYACNKTWGRQKICIQDTFPQDIGYITEVKLGTYVGGNVGFIGCEELVLKYGRGVENKYTSEFYEDG